MFIEFIVEGDDVPKVFPIEKAGEMARKLENKGVKFRLGNKKLCLRELWAIPANVPRDVL